MIVKPETLGNLFLNLSSGAFGLIIITPGLLIGQSWEETVMSITKALLTGISFLLLAEIFHKEADI